MESNKSIEAKAIYVAVGLNPRSTTREICDLKLPVVPSFSAHSSYATARPRYLSSVQEEVGVHLPPVLRDLTLDYLINTSS